MRTTDLKNADQDAIVSHLRAVFSRASDGTVVIASYGQDPKTGVGIRPKVLHTTPEDARNGFANRVLSLAGERHRNLYIPLATFAGLKPRHKGREDQIDKVLGLVGDFDDAEAGKWAERLPLSPNYVLETSPGRFQCFYLFTEPQRPEKVKPIAERLQAYCGCDTGTKDLSHVWRIPGTLNWPNKKKADGGRPLEPVTVQVAKAWSGTHTRWEDLEAALEAVWPDRKRGAQAHIFEASKPRPWNGNINNLPISQAKKDAILNGFSPGDRSEPILGVLNALVWSNLTDAEIIQVFETYPIGEKYREKGQGRERWLQPQIEKARKRVTERASDRHQKTTAPPRFSYTELAARIEAENDFENLTGEIAGLVTSSRLPESSIHKLRKTIAQKAGVTVKSLKNDAKHDGDESGYEHLEVARRVIQNIGAKNIVFFQNSFWTYGKEGVWKVVDDREVKRHIHIAGVGPLADFTRSVVDSILDITKTEAYRTNHQFDIDPTAINCLNGELHFNGKSWLVRPHCRESFRTTQIPVNYDPAARAPRFERFLNEIFIGDQERESKAILLLELVGYSLLASCEFEKFALLIGRGANGKSVLLETLAALVGPKNVCAVQPSQFENKFQRAHLRGKLVNIVTEIAEGAEIADAQLKAIVSGELTTAENKHKPPFDFKPFATCWFGTNHMPHTRDFSEALFRRAIIVTFNRVFAEHEQDKHLKNKLKNELPGILNLALEAFSGVLARGEFTRVEETENAKREWRVNCDQVAQFAEEVLEFGPGLQTLSQIIYSEYEMWAHRAGIRRTLNRKNFTLRLQRLGVEPHKGSGGQRFLAGVRVVNSQAVA